MTKSQAARLTALHRMQTFMDSNAAALGTISKSTSRTDLDTAVTGLEQYAAQQARAETAAASLTMAKGDLREELRLGHMQPIAAIARKKLGATAAMQVLALPHKNSSDVALIAAGTGMAEACAQYEAVFVAQQMPADFIAQLTAAVKAVQDAVNAQAQARLDVNEATKGVKAQLTITHTDVKVINGLVVKQLKGTDAGLLGAWTNAKRVYAKPGVATGTTTEPDVAPPPVPVPTVVPVTTPAAPAPVSAPTIPVPVVTPVPTPVATSVSAPGPVSPVVPAVQEVPTAKVA